LVTFATNIRFPPLLRKTAIGSRFRCAPARRNSP
jgi:hypothetical protein